MGYYSGLIYEISSNAKVDLDKKAEIEKYFAEYRPDVYGFQGVQLITNDEGKLEDIELEEYYSKFYDCEKFAEMLSQALISGVVELKFTGEDGEQWGYEITPNHIEELVAVWIKTKDLKNLYAKLGGGL